MFEAGSYFRLPRKEELGLERGKQKQDSGRRIERQCVLIQKYRIRLPKARPAGLAFLKSHSVFLYLRGVAGAH